MEKKTRILICDDETGIRDALKLILEEQYELFYGRNGEEAVRRLRECDPDLVVMDIKMPHLNGLDALKMIKRQAPAQKVLIISGYESSDVAATAIRMGASDYLTKPFTREEVRARVEAILGPSS